MGGGAGPFTRSMGADRVQFGGYRTRRGEEVTVPDEIPASPPEPPNEPPTPPAAGGLGGLPAYPGAAGQIPAYPTGTPSGAQTGPGGYPPPPGYGTTATATAEVGTGPGGTVLAPYGARLGGWVVDFLLLTTVGQLIATIFDRAKIVAITFNTTDRTTHVHTVHHQSVVGIVLRVLIVLLYGAIFCGSERGQTLGMMLVGVRAVDATTGGSIGFARALGRASFEYLLAILAIVPWVLDMLWPIWDRRNQTLHDKVTRTLVVKPAPPVA